MLSRHKWGDSALPLFFLALLLRVNIALGGWGFNDPPTQTQFSHMASNVENR
jgi:hypothetical protein